MLRIKVFVNHLHKITLTINKGSFMTLGNRECSQTLAEQANAMLSNLYCTITLKIFLEKRILMRQTLATPFLTIRFLIPFQLTPAK